MSLVEHTRWAWTGTSRRHTVDFYHNSISGGQRISVDGIIYHSTSWSYKLTGCIYFSLDGSTVEVYCLSNAAGELYYRLTVDGKEIKSDAMRLVSTWVVHIAGTMHQIEFEHESMNILVDSITVTDAVGDFLEEGAAYNFTIPPSGTEAVIMVLPAKSKRERRLRTKLLVNGLEIVPTEELGRVDGESSIFPAAPAVLSGSGAGSA